MAEIQKLLEVLSSPVDLLAEIRSGAVIPGLEKLYGVIEYAVSDVGDGNLGFQEWEESRFEAVVSIVEVLASAVSTFPAEKPLYIVARVLKLSLELCVLYLEKSELGSQSSKIQKRVLQVVENVLHVGSSPTSSLFNLSYLVELLSNGPANSVKRESLQDSECIGGGLVCLVEMKAADRFFVSVGPQSSSLTQLRISSSTEGLIFGDLKSMTSHVQHWAVVHLGCICRLLDICNKGLLSLPKEPEWNGAPLLSRLTLIVRILRLLNNLAKETELVPSDAKLLPLVACVADGLSSLFRLNVDLHDIAISDHSAAEDSLDYLAVRLLEEYFGFLQVVFPDGLVLKNIQTCLLANVLSILEPEIWRYDKHVDCQRLPLVYAPRVIMHLLKLFGEVRGLSGQLYVWSRSIGMDLLCGSLSETSAPVCHTPTKNVALLEKHSYDECLDVVFPASGNWLDNLIHLAGFFYTEGMKLRPKLEKTLQNCPKSSSMSEVDPGASNEDEALFGDLFSEPNRQLGIAEVSDQARVSTKLNFNLFLQANIELLEFLKDFIFAPEWSSAPSKDACIKLTLDHIGLLMPMLLYQSNQAKDGDHESDLILAFEKQLEQISDLCFYLLRCLLCHHIFPGKLEDDLVDVILKVQNGTFIYSSFSLTLLGHALISRVGDVGCALRKRIFMQYIGYMMEKSNLAYDKHSTLEEVAKSMPCPFHIEILLMAFHLSADPEKATLANLLSSALNSLDDPPDDFTAQQLTVWSFIISRLLLLVHHMVFYPSRCPSWLFLCVRSKLSRNTLKGDSFDSSDCHLLSWPLIVFRTMLGEPYNAHTLGRIFNSQLFDTVPFPLPSRIDGPNLKWPLDLLRKRILRIVDLWSHKVADKVEQLILERYCFVICWDTLRCLGKSELVLQSLDINNLDDLFFFSHLLVEDADVLGSVDVSSLKECVMSMLLQLQNALSRSSNDLLGLNFFRYHSWLSLLLSFLDAGAWQICSQNQITGAKSLAVSPTQTETISSLSGNLVTSLIKDGRIGWLLRTLFTLLVDTVEVLQEAFIRSLDCEQDALSKFSPLLLLKHRGLTKDMHDELLSRLRIKPEMLDYVCSVLPKVDHLIAKENGLAKQMVLRSMLHGFPSYCEGSTAVYLSCILSVESMIVTIEGLLQLGYDVTDTSTDVWRLLGTLSTVKMDKSFQKISRSCEAIWRHICPSNEWKDCDEILVLKHIEGFLKEVDLDSKEGHNSYIIETLIGSAVDIIRHLIKDPANFDSLKFYAGGKGGVSKQTKELNCNYRVDLLMFMDSLDNSLDELVNVKVLKLYLDLMSGGLCPGVKEELLQKFLKMDSQSLSDWLGKRILGCQVEGPEGNVSLKSSSLQLLEVTMNFILNLVSGFSHVELQNKLIHSMLIIIERAFSFSDLQTIKSYFSFIVQLAAGGSGFKSLLNKTVMLMEKLSSEEKMLQALRFLFGFFTAVFKAMGANKNYLDHASSKQLLYSSSTAGSTVSRQVSISRKGTETLALPASQETDPGAVDCDEAFLDDDDDDGTSDGELASMDKDDDDDSNSERALASKVCTFTSSGSNFMEQHWYFCYTCDLTVSKGCCSVCAKVCHKGHRVVYSRSSRFFCDCGAGGVRGSSCQCLKPRKFTVSIGPPVKSAAAFNSFLPLSDDTDQPPDNDSDVEDVDCLDMENTFKFTIPVEEHEEIKRFLKDLDIENRILELCQQILPSITGRRDSNLLKDQKLVLGEDKVLSYNAETMQLKKAYKSGSFDLKLKMDYSNSRELKTHLSCGSLTKSLVSISTRGRVAAGEGDKVSIFDAGQIIGQPTVGSVAADKANIKPLSKNVVRFEIVHLAFNPSVENYLAVAGYEECQVLTINPRGEVSDRLSVELALQGAYIRHVDWLPGSQVRLMVVTNLFVKIYDLSQDNISPTHYFTLQDDVVVDAVLVAAPKGRMFLLVLSELGKLYRLQLSMQLNSGAKALTETIHIQDKQLKGMSLYYSRSHRLLFLSYQDGTSLIGQLDSEATVLSKVSFIYEDESDGQLKPAGLHHWKELFEGSGVFVCFSSFKFNALLAISLSPHELASQNLRQAVGSALSLVGIAAYKPLSKDKIHAIALYDDGSLQVYSLLPIGTDIGQNVLSDQVKKLGSCILSRSFMGSNPEFPLDFFERTICITQDVKLSGDAIQNNDSEGTKQTLATEDGFLESPSPSGFNIAVTNLNPDMVMVGCRIHVGNSSASHIPSNVSIFQRVIKLEEGLRSWYDIPFTTAEALLADEEFTITIGPTFNGSVLSRIDSLEIYGRAKDDFGWKDKMDAILNVEAHALSSGTGVVAGKWYRSLQASSIQEQVVAEGLKLLSSYYSLYRVQSNTPSEEIDPTSFKCKNLLEVIFSSDRESLLQAAACLVLHVLFPKKETYYQVKDSMRLLGVVSASPSLASRIGAGGVAARLVINEFTTQLQAVSKIALHRRENMAAFLENHGSGLVDGLMEVLWSILDAEQPDNQTINNIVIPSVELIYSYAECLALHGSNISARSVAPAASSLCSLLFARCEAVQTSSSLAISSRLLQVPFPKQTMLATDDVVDGSTTPAASLVANIPGEPTQVMIEEDAAASSVQYCCDGCSTVPILSRRWHCNVCPDFDLCEACYEVMDADRLPPPHSRDHSMSAIPIEIDSFVVDGSEIQFSMDELSSTSLLHVANDVSIQNSHPADHLLELNDANDFPAAADQRVVLISASKRAVNSLLLTELVDQLKGWMETVNGIKALPVMQLFYRLSSAVGGPFMDSSKSENLDLEKFVRWLLEEIHLDRAFPAKVRSPFGEVTILIFMFFTLMLRNWHQPGSDAPMPKSSEAADKGPAQGSCTSSVSPSTDEQGKNEFMCQLVRACTALRQQAFINYLLDILEQLVQVFKSPPSNLEASQGLASAVGCGALLTVRRELPAGNFIPFFSDSYGKAHRVDLFVDYHKLLLENTFRLVYSLIRPEKLDKSIEKDKSHKVPSNKDLRLDGYQDVLCSYINNPHTSFVRRYARRLFLHLCGSKTQYYTVRDSWQMSSEIKKLYKLVNKSGDFHDPVPYERSVKLIKCLTVISEVAAARPRNWQKYCSKHAEVLSDLLKWIFYFGEESAIQALKLLSLAFYFGKEIDHSQQKSEADTGNSSSKASVSQSSDSKKKKKSEDGSESSTDKSFLDMEASIEIFTEGDCSSLKHFIDCFLLEWNSTSIRTEAKSVMYGIWHHGKLSFKEKMLKILLEKVKCLPVYGQNIIEYTELLTWLLGKAVTGNCEKHQEANLITTCLSNDVISLIFETFKSQNELLANHPNSRIYNTLSGLVEFDGYYLESEPCVACSCPEVPYSRMKLEALKSETKFTDNRIIVKCTGSFTIQSVTMNVHDARKSKSVKVLNLYHNNRPVSDLSELKNNWSLWKRSKSCHLSSNQTELKVEFPIPITACNFMIELDSFYENLQASSLESLQCPRCSRNVTDKHGICSSCHENAYQCRQCRNINYENLDSFLCNECGYSKYGRFEFNFMAKPSFIFDCIENDEDMKKALAAIELESENAHRRYQQLLGFKKPLLKLVSSIGDNDMDSQQKDSVQQMMVSLPGPSCKINRKIALLGVLYGEKCKASFDSVSKSVQTLQGLRRVLMAYLHQKNASPAALSECAAQKSPKRCYGCATTFVTQSLELLQVLAKQPNCKKQLVSAGVLSELFENNIHQGPKAARIQARAVICAFCEGDINAVTQLNNLIKKKVIYCLEHHRSMDIALVTREELLLLSEACSISDELWEARLRIAFQLFFSSIKLGAQHPAISEHVILPCLRIVSQACTPPKLDSGDQGQIAGKPESASQTKDATSGSASSISTSASGTKIQPVSEKHWDGFKKGQEIRLCSYSEWDKGASYLDFVRRQYKISQTVKAAAHRSRRDSSRLDFLALKYALKWKWHACKGVAKDDLPTFELGSWVSELVLSSCSPSIRSEICTLIGLLYARSTRKLKLLNLLMELLPKTLAAGESAADYFDLLFKMIDSDDARLFLTVKGFLTTICRLITREVVTIESLENSLHIDISQGFILHKLIELLSKFLEVPNIRTRFMCHDLLSQVLEALVVTRGLVIQKTKLISDCNRLLNDLLDGLLHESRENKRHFIRACVSGLQKHGEQRKGRTSLFILEQLCNLICPSKPEHVYLLILNKAHTQEEFIRGSMTKNPYSSTEIGSLMRDVKNKICHQLELLGLLEDDYGMELLVAGNIISLDLSIAQVYELVWRKSHSQSLNTASNSLSAGNFTPARDCPPMTVTYRLQGLDGEATEPMIKELEEDREECQDPEVEFAIAGAVREFGGLEIILSMIQRQRDEELKSNKEELVSVLNLLMYCCKIRENRRALLRLGALGLLLETARRAFSVDAVEPAEGILLIVESLTMEANETDIGIAESVREVSSEEAGTGHQAKKIVLMFLERLSHPSGIKMSAKQQRNNEMVARILPYLTYGEQEAMEALVQHFVPYLHDWSDFDRLQKLHQDNPEDESLAQRAAEQKHAVENFVRVSESLKTSSCGERLKSMILDKGITGVAVTHLRSSFAVTVQAGFKSSSEWATAVKLPSVPLILSMIRGLSMGHLGTQKCIDEDGILPLLHALEGVSGENEIGARAENLLDTLSGKEGIIDGFLKDKVLKLRHATRDEMRRLALKKREELLQGLGMRQEISEGGEHIVVAQATIEGLEDVEEEEGLACMVCREGYGLRPSDMLGTYSYGKRVNLGSGTSNNGRGECVYTTVSHFNIIHYQCHQEAKRADAALKNPKKEWEGAALRNNETLCNCIFPLRGPSVPLGQYVRCVDQYWDNLNALGRADGSRLRLLTYDIVLMLARFATRASFSTDSKGGGRESNSRLLPFMFQMARHLIDQGGVSQRHVLAKSVTNYLNVGPSELKPSALSSSRSSGPEETVQFMMVNSVLAESYQEWLRHRRKFLQRGIYHAYMQHSHGRSSSLSPSSSSTMLKIPTNQQDEHGKEVQLQSGEDMFAVVQPMLVYMGLIEQLQQFFKHNRTKTTPTSSISASTSGNAKESGGGLEEWEVTMKERLMNLKETLNFSKELLSWLEEMQSAADLQEAFDVIGVLGDVLSEGVTQCEDFVKSAIDTGKS